MAKRSHDDGDISTVHRNLGDPRESKKKKRKIEQAGVESQLPIENPKDKLSKEKRRELKRLRKTKRQDAAVELYDPAQNGTKILETDKAAAKAARKEEKRRIKAERKGNATDRPTETEDGPVQESQENLEGHDLNDGREEIGNGDLPKGESEKVLKARRKAAKKAEKARKEASKESRRSEKTEESHLNGNGDLGKGIATSTTAQSSKAHLEVGYTQDPALTSLPPANINSFVSGNFIDIKDPSSTIALRPITKFAYLPASCQSAAFSTFDSPTPIQAAAWPFLLSGRDVIGVAETGSGKTLAFGIPCVRSIASSQIPQNPSKSPLRAAIISPTRELALQIHAQLESLATPAGLSTACVYGGIPKDTQRLALKTAHILIATPGRLNDLIDEGVADLSLVKYLVLDEADRMLDTGFEDAVRAIISATPSSPPAGGRQTLMFTATWPPSVRSLASTFMHNPVHISIGENNADGNLRANTRIEQRVEILDPRSKNTRLLQLLKQQQRHHHQHSDNQPSSAQTPQTRILIFCLYKKEASRLTSFLSSHQPLPVASIHGDLSQSLRLSALQGFKSGTVPLLVATDVAARGLDIPSVKLVINYTFPLTVEDYVHRIGRTGRAGESGVAVTFFTEAEKTH
ncbi:MAG: hypothetical protein Q9190_006288, partial [Brigantiaea leucoxantha]